MEFTGERYVPSLRGQISYEHLHRYAIAASLSAGQRVLDAASGEGYGSALLARVAASVVGIDIDERSVEHARRSYYAANLRFMRGSVTELPLPDASFDVCASFETIEHLSDHARMIDEIRRVLAPSGVLVISSPNRFVYSDIAAYDNPYHVRELYFPEFRDVLASRFQHVRLYGQRVAISSLVHPLAGGRSESARFYSGGTPETSGLTTLPDPVYFIAVCSAEPLDLDASSCYLDPSDDVLADIWRELNALRSGMSDGRPGMLASAAPIAALASPPKTPQFPEAGATDAAEAGARHAETAAQLAQLRDEVAQSHAAFLRTDAELTAAAEQVRQLEVRAAAAQRDAEAAEEARRASEESATALRAALPDASARELEAIHRLSEDLGALRADLAAQQDAAAAAIAARNAERAGAVAVAEDLNERYARLKNEIRSLHAQLDESRSAIAARDTVIAELERQLAAVTGALSDAARDGEALREVLESRSWKMTAPLRRAVRSLRR